MEKSRIQQINEYLLRNTKTIYRIRKIQATENGEKRICAYVVSLAKCPPFSLEDQVLQFYENCKNVLRENEELRTQGRCFIIAAETFEVSYCLEAYRKTADRGAYMENGQVKIELLRRMSCERAAAIFNKHKVDPLAILNTGAVLQQYSNPADKYAALAKYPVFLKEAHKE